MGAGNKDVPGTSLISAPVPKKQQAPEKDSSLGVKQFGQLVNHCTAGTG
jgi:hypothetical protein